MSGLHIAPIFVQIVLCSVEGDHVNFSPSTCTRSIGRKSLHIAKDSRLNNAKLLMPYLHHQYADSSIQTSARLSKLLPKATKGQYWAYYPKVVGRDITARGLGHFLARRLGLRVGPFGGMPNGSVKKLLHRGHHGHTHFS